MHGLNIDPNNQAYGNPLPEELKSLGVDCVRFTYHDETDSDQLDPSRLDFFSNKVDALAGSDVQSLLILSYSTYPNKPAFEAPLEEWAIYIDKFTRRVKQIAYNFSTISHYVAFQIWNEPDLPNQPGYTPGLRPEVYSLMLERACQVIREVDREFGIKFMVVSAGLASGDPSWWQRVYKGQPFNALAIHPYGQRPEKDWPHPGWGFGDLENLINSYKAVWGGYIWITECGEDTYNEVEQAQYLQKFYNTVKTKFTPTVQEVFWFCRSDGMVKPYGLLREDGSPKPAYDVFRQVAKG